MKHIPAAIVATAGAATAVVTALAGTSPSVIPGAPPAAAEHRVEQRAQPRTDLSADATTTAGTIRPITAPATDPPAPEPPGLKPPGLNPPVTDSSAVPPGTPHPADPPLRTTGTGSPLSPTGVLPPSPLLLRRLLPHHPPGPSLLGALAAGGTPQPALRPSSDPLRPDRAPQQPSAKDLPAGPCALSGPSSGVTEAATTPAGYSRTSGTVRALTLFVDFPDAPARTSPQARNAEFFPATADYFRRSSYGRLDYRSTPVLRWLRMSRPFSAYGIQRGSSFDVHSGKGYAALSREILAAVDDEVDFRRFDLVNVLATPNAGPPATRSVLSVTFSGSDTGLMTDDGVPLRNTSFIWSRQNGDSAYRVLNHENAHSFGLPDLYYADDSGAPDAVGHWDLMNEDWGPANDLLGWHKWKLGWLSPNQVTCLHRPGESAEYRLTPISTPGGTKLLTVPLDSRRAIAIEARERGPLDRAVCRPGVLVYQVSTDVPSGQGPTRVMDAKPHSGGCHSTDPNVNSELTDAPFAAGETYTDRSSDLRVQALGKAADGTYRVRVTTPSAPTEPAAYPTPHTDPATPHDDSHHDPAATGPSATTPLTTTGDLPAPQHRARNARP
ncbi:M6 family metalloprotease domain-containing protein [Streptomyces sp. NPDC059740]|uniref:M6 family metalloprotease domain-containing protein n=1 Tax=Streptomyces sp. NPDC059740 TaxID=3346926 RepID=UPI003657B882